MKVELSGALVLRDFEPTPADLRSEFLAGLKQAPKQLPCKFFYDAEGSRLFDRICGLPEYYLTRTESHILRDNIGEIVALCGSRCLLVELGSGSSSKTRLLLDHLPDLSAYVPIDISRRHLLRAAQVLHQDYVPLEILPVCADYNQSIRLPTPVHASDRTLVFFPGSTIGNFEPKEATVFLQRVASWCAPGDGLLIGVDLAKSGTILEAAYNDPQGVTAAFNLNLLRRANRELEANFDVAQFRHSAVYNEAHERIEMRLVSQRRQRVVISGHEFHFGRGEPILTEYSHKFRLDRFHQLCSEAGWQARRSWSDRNRWFNISYLERASTIWP